MSLQIFGKEVIFYNLTEKNDVMNKLHFTRFIWEQCLNNFDTDCSFAQVTFNPVLHEKDQPQAAIFCIAGSQTRYFPFKVRRTRLIKDKPQGIYWPPDQGVSSWEEENRRSFFIFLSRAPRSFSRARSALELADVLEKNEKKKTPVYRLFFV